MVLAGDLKERVIFYEPTRTQDASGDPLTTYAEVLSTYAKVEQIRSLPNVEASKESIRDYLKLIIRYRVDLPILNGYKAVWRGLEFIVNNIKVDPLRTSIEIMIAADIETSDRTP